MENTPRRHFIGCAQEALNIKILYDRGRFIVTFPNNRKYILALNRINHFHHSNTVASSFQRTKVHQKTMILVQIPTGNEEKHTLNSNSRSN